MEIPKNYNPSEAEAKWYPYWMNNGYFRSVPDEREPYTIVIPPPNVTGVLHMGHMLNNTIQDVMIRRARMLGKNACWVPGTDHASIATEAKVVSMLKEKGIKKSDLTREEFLKYAFEWKEKYGGIILEQLKKLGASCDWDRTRFTMEDDLSEAVIDVFIDLFKKGYGILDLKQNQAQGDFYSVNRIDKLDAGQRYERGYYTVDNTRWIKKATQATIKTIPNIYLAPTTPRIESTTPIRNNTLNATILGIYPNPFVQDVYVQYNIFQTSEVKIELIDMLGNIIFAKNKGLQPKGLYNETLNIENIASGNYRLIIRSGNNVIQKSVQKF